MVAPRHNPDNDAAVPTRAQLDAAPRELIRAGRWYKADVYAASLDGRQMVIKDFAAKALPTRLVGRAQIGHECRAYRWLGRMRGIPHFFGRVDAHALAVERIVGSELIVAASRFEHRRRHLHSLRAVIDRFLELGFFHLDVRNRHNVMVTDDGEVMLLDLAGSLWVRPNSSAHRMFSPCLLAFYHNVLHKWRKLLTPGRSARGEKSALSRILMILRMPHKLRRERKRWKNSP